MARYTTPKLTVDGKGAGQTSEQMVHVATASKLRSNAVLMNSSRHRTLPEPISFDPDEPAETELAFHLQARDLEIKERIYRPFLYRSIHKPRQSSEQLAMDPLVRPHVTTCSKLIHHWDVFHRHHGTWLMARQSFTSTLLLLAAQKSGVGETAAEQCEESTQCTLSTLRFWEGEAPDLKASRLILEDISRQLQSPINT